ncbi:MAG TPA: sulfite exporter TauE/SafE family protein [Methylophilaceae bacterium]|nr:sulfite exporter TauE/SafE family protein [Methylophilaceae bacterium]
MEFLFYLIAGACAGLLSGLFGVGGGVIIVSILSFIFTGLQFPEASIMHLALGTSLATIIFTSISSALAHHKKSNVDWTVFKQIAPAVVIGTLLGSLIAAQLHSIWLKGIFSAFLISIAIQLLITSGKKKTVSHEPKPPNLAMNSIAGLFIGIVSSLVGIGGGTLSVPYLTYSRADIRRAIGTSAAIGLPIAIAGTIGFVVTGLMAETGVIAENGVQAVLPEYSIGYVYLPAFIGISVTSIFTAPLGTSIAQRLPTSVLKRLFALLLFFVGIKMLWGIL